MTSGGSHDPISAWRISSAPAWRALCKAPCTTTTSRTGAYRIIKGVYRVQTEPAYDYANPPLTLIPSYPDLPMEEVYPRVEKTDIPEAYVREYGRGRVVYFPWDVDRAFWEVLCLDHGRLLANAVDWATNEERPVTVEGPGVLDVTIWQQQESLTVHLVNLTNPMMMKGPVRELYPVGRQIVRCRLPEGQAPRRVQLLKAGGEPAWELQGGMLTVTVPSIVDHEVVAVDISAN